ncbi:stromal cell-derived factor 2 [Schistocerca americana]|uniref:stromal cell-derived factor 2 n=1 Tax=Schistocerca americana TaxID=7009 RepID=UPI001F4F6C78|nr:stromal cell-derived factor 2 [Schistocerca americana]
MELGRGAGMSAGVVLLVFCFFLHVNIISGRASQYVTCGSVIKLMNVDFKVRLHSHDVKYGTGSGQQSVTGTEVQEDVNSHWTIKGTTGKHCIRGEPVKCGDIIRLTHLATLKNLHSHHFASPLSGDQEISAYGDDNGVGDSGDHWMVLCEGEFWERDEAIMLKHVDTEVYLSATGRTYGRPINGQAEIVGVPTPAVGHVHWKAMEGLFIHPSDFNPKSQHTHTHHTEL